MLDEQRLAELAAEERRAYNREWKRKNPDKVRAERERYWRKRALKRLEEEATKKEVTK